MNKPTTPLERARIRAMFTQAAVARKIGVELDVYKKYENRKLEVPVDRSKEIADLLKCTPFEAQCRTPLRSAGRCEPDDKHYYFGECVVRMASCPRTFVLPISELQSNDRHWLQKSSSPYLIVPALDNRLFIAGKRFVSDVFISSEAADEYAPVSISDHTQCDLTYSDTEFWDYVSLVDDFVNYDRELDLFDLDMFVMTAFDVGLDLRDFSHLIELPENIDLLYRDGVKKTGWKPEHYFDTAKKVRYKVRNHEEVAVEVQEQDLLVLKEHFIDDDMSSEWVSFECLNQPMSCTINPDQLEYLILPLNKVGYAEDQVWLEAVRLIREGRVDGLYYDPRKVKLVTG